MDDALDYAGEREATGKALYVDLREGKITLPLLRAVAKRPALLADLESARAGDEVASFRLVAAVAESGVCDEVRVRAREETRAALAALESVPPAPRAICSRASPTISLRAWAERPVSRGPRPTATPPPAAPMSSGPESAPESGWGYDLPETVGKEKRALSSSEVAVSDVIGRLIEFWGFKRNMGRVWAVLYLSSEPLSAEDLRYMLKLSSGAVSMTLSELSRWGVVRRVWVQGERKDFYAAEVQIWRMISRVFNEREKAEIIAAIDAFEEALVHVDRLRASTDAKVRVRAELQRERIAHLLELAKLGQRLIDALVTTAKLDAEPLVRFLLGARSRSPSP